MNYFRVWVELYRGGRGEWLRLSRTFPTRGSAESYAAWNYSDTLTRITKD